MRIAVAGLPFEIGPSNRLNPAELESVRRFDAASGDVRLDLEPFTLDVDDVRDHNPSCTLPAVGEPAEIESCGLEVRLRHHDFSARLDLAADRGALRRHSDLSYPLEIILRTAMCCRLPLVGGVALHAAGLVVDGRGAVFFGPSGAGKTTIARAAPYPALSDELVAIHQDPWRLMATGYWGELGDRRVERGEAPLAGLFSLAKGVGLELICLEPADAFRRLLPVVVLPTVPDLWQRATTVLARLVRELPVRTMVWSLRDTPWAELAGVVNQRRVRQSCAAAHAIEGDRHVA